jgi:hypothetical protein
MTYPTVIAVIPESRSSREEKKNTSRDYLSSAKLPRD